MVHGRSLMPPPADAEPVSGIQLTDLEKALAGSDAAAKAALKGALDSIAKIHDRAGRTMSAGAAPADFALLQAVAGACEAAKRVLNSTTAAGGTDTTR